jgi:hypothetical protein
MVLVVGWPPHPITLPYFGTGGFEIYLKITGMRNTENFFMICFVFSQQGAGQGNVSPWL